MTNLEKFTKLLTFIESNGGRYWNRGRCSNFAFKEGKLYYSWWDEDYSEKMSGHREKLAEEKDIKYPFVEELEEEAFKIIERRRKETALKFIYQS